MCSVHNIKTGPFLFEAENIHQVNSIFAIAIITQFLLIPCGFGGIKFFGWILRLPRHIVLVGPLSVPYKFCPREEYNFFNSPGGCGLP